MKHFIIIIMSFSCVTLFGQVRCFNNIPKDILSQLDKMGVDSLPLLNSYESRYFNTIFKDSLKGFDFTNKKIGFLAAGSKKNKKEYFEEEKKRFYNGSTTINGTLYVFNASQKKESGGYDAVIVYWSKFLMPIDKIVAKLKE